MGVLNYIAYIAFGVIFLSVVGVLFSSYQRTMAEERFLLQLKGLSEIVKNIRLRDVGSSESFIINIPQGWTVTFQENLIVGRSGQRTENFYVGVKVSGEELREGNFRLNVVRTGSGVEVTKVG